MSAGSVLQRQKRFSRRIAPIETRPLLLVQVFSIGHGGGFRVESERQVHPFNPFPFIAKVGAADNRDHDVKKVGTGGGMRVTPSLQPPGLLGEQSFESDSGGAVLVSVCRTAGFPSRERLRWADSMR